MNTNGTMHKCPGVRCLSSRALHSVLFRALTKNMEQSIGELVRVICS